MAETHNADAHADHGHGHDDHGHGHGHHEVHPPSFYYKTFGVLLVLFAISVIGPVFEIPLLTLITAFGVAFVKAGLVIRNFMHLNVERPIVWYSLSTALVFMVLFFFGTAPDVMNHEGSNWVNDAGTYAPDGSTWEEYAIALEERLSHHGEGDHGEAGDHGGEHKDAGEHKDGGGEEHH